jgi:hypothetical protein
MLLHKHHIIPKHAGGTDDTSNIVYLTVAEHAEAHRILFEKYGRWQDEIAWKGLSGRIKREHVQREAVRRANTGKKMSDETKKKISQAKKSIKQSPTHVENNRRARQGKKLSEKHIENISKALKGKPHSPEHNAKVGRKGRVFTEEWKKKMSEAAKARHARNREFKHTTIIGEKRDTD